MEDKANTETDSNRAAKMAAMRDLTRIFFFPYEKWDG
jgi:hypothetical protein